MKLKFVSILFLVSLLVAPGCSRYRVPKGFPKPDEMAIILADVHVVESTLFYMQGQSGSQSEAPGKFKYVLAKHGLTPAEFDTIRKWYVDRPELYQRVYDLVLERLSQMDADVRMQNEQERELRTQAEKLALKERLQNLWPDSTSITIAQIDSMEKGCPFRITVDTLELVGEVKMTAGYQFLRNDESRSPKVMLSAFYNDSVADTVYQTVTHSFHKQTEELLLRLKQDTFPQFIDGYLLLTDSLHSSSVKISDIRIQVISDSLQMESSAENTDSTILPAPENLRRN